MNKNVILSILIIAFLFAGCKKKDKTNTLTESGISLLAYGIQFMGTSQSNISTYKLSGSIIAAAPFSIVDHGFILKGTSPLQISRLGSSNTIGYFEDLISFDSKIPVFPDSLVSYVVLANGDSIRSDRFGSNQQVNYSNFTISDFNVADSASLKTQLSLLYSYNPNIYSIGSQVLYYRINNKNPWTPTNQYLTPSNNLINYNISGISSLSQGNYYDFQVIVVLNPISATGTPSMGSSSIINCIYY